MSARPFGSLFQQLRRLTAPPAGTADTDRQLLERFVVGHDEDAFADLVRRHGPMVYGVCRRLLANGPDAEDAFQATFLVLVRRAGSIPWRDTVGGWLHQVAQRVALKARAQTQRRRAAALPADLAESAAPDDVAERDLRSFIDEELQRLPAKYRAPLVLCCLEGRTHDEAAQELGWPRGSMAKRLARAQDLLRARLSGRGVALGALPALTVAVPDALAAGTVEAAGLFAAGAEVVGPDQAVSLAQGVLKTMLLTRVKAAIGGVLVAGLLGASVYFFVAAAVGAPGDETGQESTQAAQAPLPEQPGPAPDPDWGVIKGRLVWAGAQLPETPELKVDKDAQHCLERGKILGEEWVVDKNSKGVHWVFVWLSPEPGAEQKLPVHPSLKDIPQQEVVVDQPCCRFEPHCVALRQGQTLLAKNSSPVPHNFNYTGHPLRNQGQNLLLPAGTSTAIKDLKADDRFPVAMSCNIHPWMKGYVRVFDHPYFALTDKDGAFEIKHAPRGAWRLKVWHDTGWRGGAAGRDGEKIDIKGGAVTDLGKLEMKPQ